MQCSFVYFPTGAPFSPLNCGLESSDLLLPLLGCAPSFHLKFFGNACAIHLAMVINEDVDLQ